MLRLLPTLGFALIILRTATCPATSVKTENVIFIAIDGVRWHEVYKGCDEAFISEKSPFVKDRAYTRQLLKG